MEVMALEFVDGTRNLKNQSVVLHFEVFHLLFKNNLYVPFRGDLSVVLYFEPKF